MTAWSTQASTKCREHKNKPAGSRSKKRIFSKNSETRSRIIQRKWASTTTCRREQRLSSSWAATTEMSISSAGSCASSSEFLFCFPTQTSTSSKCESSSWSTRLSTNSQDSSWTLTRLSCCSVDKYRRTKLSKYSITLLRDRDCSKAKLPNVPWIRRMTCWPKPSTCLSGADRASPVTSMEMKKKRRSWIKWI